jgi:hypothetical protein
MKVDRGPGALPYLIVPRMISAQKTIETTPRTAAALGPSPT